MFVFFPPAKTRLISHFARVSGYLSEDVEGQNNEVGVGEIRSLVRFQAFSSVQTLTN